MRRIALFLLAILLPLTAAPAQARLWEPGGGVTFNTPHPWGGRAARARIVLKVEQAIRRIKPSARDPHPELLIAAFLFDRNSSADAIIGACRRGVSVRVIIDRDVASRPFRRIVTALNADNATDRNHDGVPDHRPRAGRCNRKIHHKAGETGGQGIPLMSKSEVRRALSRPTGNPVTWGKDGSYVLKCSGSCRGANDANMHAKIYAFSTVGSADNVVMLASTNLNGGGVNTGWNDLYVIKNRPDTFAFVEKMHHEMTAQKHAGRELVELVDGPFTLRFFPMVGVGIPRDPLMVDLRKIRCTSDVGPTQLYIQQFWWNGPRGVHIWNKVRSLATHGCKVHIIFGAVDRRLRAKMHAARRAGLIEFFNSRVDTDDDGLANTRTHMKSLAIRGTYGDNPRYAGVWTGTANWAQGSLTRGDEVTLNVESASLYRRYVQQWFVVRRHSRVG
ncbi:MAG: phospholipase D-like domain-containing protein [Nocardioidaceae bacterium]